MYSGQLSRKLGLIIGVNNYQDPSFQPLQCAENDARALAQWLVNTRGGNWAPGNVQHVQGSHATQELVQSLIGQMCINNAEKGDLVLIYFAGHAFIDEGSGEGYLALANTRTQDTGTALHISSLFQNIMLRSQAGHILVILDCFQIGRRWNMQRTSAYDSSPLFKPALLNALQSYNNRLFLCSCRGNEFLAETAGHQLGAFMRSLVLGLCGAAGTPSTNTITLQQIQQHLVSTLNEQHRPQLFGQDQPPLLLLESAPQPDSSQQLSPSQPAATAGANTSSPPSGQRGPLFQPRPTRTAYATATAQKIETSPDLSQNIGMDQQRQQQYNTFMNQAQQYFQGQKYPEAFTIVEQALYIFPNDPTALLLKSQILGAGGRIQEALMSIDQLLQLDPNNALGWRTRAVLLSNMGQQQAALETIERALVIEPNNPEAYGIKNTILANLAMQQNRVETPQPPQSPGREKTRANAATFVIALLVQVGGLAAGIIGALLLALATSITSFPGLLLISAGLLLLCSNATRGTHRYGIVMFIPTLLISLLTGAIPVAAYKFGYTRILALLQVHTTLLVPLLFLIGWLIIAAVIPLLLAIGGLITGAIARARKC